LLLSLGEETLIWRKRSKRERNEKTKKKIKNKKREKERPPLESVTISGAVLVETQYHLVLLCFSTLG
jgi:hypothetical protein